MNTIANHTSCNPKEVWRTLFTYKGVHEEEFAKKREFWETNAILIAGHLNQQENVLLQLLTAGGKTFIACLAIALLNRRTLFLAPSRPLVRQQWRLLCDTLGATFPSRMITGETGDTERIWNNADERIVFATPDVVLAEYAHGRFSFEDFGLVVLDEAHETRGDHAYSLIATMAWEKDVRIFGMSASPAKNEQDLRALMMRLHIFRMLTLVAKGPFRSEEVRFVKMSEEGSKADLHEWTLLHKRIRRSLAERISNAGIAPPKEGEGIIIANELERITRTLEQKPKDVLATRLAWFELARYKKLVYAYRVFIMEGYVRFLEYAKRLDEEKKPSSTSLVQESLFRGIRKIAEREREHHPKHLALIELLLGEVRFGRRSIVFFAERATATYAKAELQKHGVACETFFGRSGMRKGVRSQIDQLRDGEIRVLLTTSVTQQGISVPEVDTVVNYSLPQLAIARLQRAGRTARAKPGSVIHLVIDHPFDRVTFFAVARSLRKLEEMQRAQITAHAAPQQAFSF